MKPLLHLVHLHKSGESVGTYSVYSSHPLALEATLLVAQEAVSYARACVPAASLDNAHIHRGTE